MALSFPEWSAPAAAEPTAASIPIRYRIRSRLANPVAVFILLSLFFGIATMLANPPLRGADETAHVLRIFAIARGEIVPSAQDEQGRRGLLLPARLHDDFDFFESARHKISDEGFSYREVANEYLRRRATRPAQTDTRPPVFVLYQGSEAYSPAAYLPYIPAALAARVSGLDFVAMLYLLRLTGLLITTAITAYGIALMPHLRWAFALIALLPMALYLRATVNVDGMVLGATMVIVALCMRSALRFGDASRFEHAAWMTLSILGKPPQAAFILLEAMRRPIRDSLRHWRTLCLIALPGLLLAIFWILAISGDAGTWRVVDGTDTAEDEFAIVRKFPFMLQHPLHFFTSMISTLDRYAEFWRQLLGVLGWSDISLREWVYPVLTVMLPLVFLSPMSGDRSTRWRVAAVTGLSALVYFVAIFLIFYLVWTPIDEPKVWGVQGRYFIVLLPLAAIVVSALIRRGFGERTIAAIAVAGAVLSGAATIEAVVRVHW